MHTVRPHPPIRPPFTHSTALFPTLTERYDLLKEIGRGGFSTVYQCRDRDSGATYAVKVVDLRPLRLRERFNPARLRREVDIMRRLHHPNIIQFVDVYETPDQVNPPTPCLSLSLPTPPHASPASHSCTVPYVCAQLMMVMEYCPGDELFDVILAKKVRARPLFLSFPPFRSSLPLSCLSLTF